MRFATKAFLIVSIANSEIGSLARAQPSNDSSWTSRKFHNLVGAEEIANVFESSIQGKVSFCEFLDSKDRARKFADFSECLAAITLERSTTQRSPRAILTFAELGGKTLSPAQQNQSRALLRWESIAPQTETNKASEARQNKNKLGHLLETARNPLDHRIELLFETPRSVSEFIPQETIGNMVGTSALGETRLVKSLVVEIDSNLNLLRDSGWDRQGLARRMISPINRPGSLFSDPKTAGQKEREIKGKITFLDRHQTEIHHTDLAGRLTFGPQGSQIQQLSLNGQLPDFHVQSIASLLPLPPTASPATPEISIKKRSSSEMKHIFDAMNRVSQDGNNTRVNACQRDPKEILETIKTRVEQVRKAGDPTRLIPYSQDSEYIGVDHNLEKTLLTQTHAEYFYRPVKGFHRLFPNAVTGKDYLGIEFGGSELIYVCWDGKVQDGNSFSNLRVRVFEKGYLTQGIGGWHESEISLKTLPLRGTLSVVDDVLPVAPLTQVLGSVLKPADYLIDTTRNVFLGGGFRGLDMHDQALKLNMRYRGAALPLGDGSLLDLNDYIDFRHLQSSQQKPSSSTHPQEVSRLYDPGTIAQHTLQHFRGKSVFYQIDFGPDESKKFSLQNLHVAGEFSSPPNFYQQRLMEDPDDPRLRLHNALTLGDDRGILGQFELIRGSRIRIERAGAEPFLVYRGVDGSVFHKPCQRDSQGSSWICLLPLGVPIDRVSIEFADGLRAPLPPGLVGRGDEMTLDFRNPLNPTEPLPLVARMYLEDQAMPVKEIRVHGMTLIHDRDSPRKGDSALNPQPTNPWIEGRLICDVSENRLDYDSINSHLESRSRFQRFSSWLLGPPKIKGPSPFLTQETVPCDYSFRYRKGEPKSFQGSFRYKQAPDSNFQTHPPKLNPAFPSR